MNAYAIYLRKSRADVEAEARGEGETLARHRSALRALAERRGLNVVREYAELVTDTRRGRFPQRISLRKHVAGTVPISHSSDQITAKNLTTKIREST